MPRPHLVNRRKGLTCGQSEIELSVLVQKRLGVEVPPTALRKFICDNFTILSILSHEIKETGVA